MSIRVKIEPLNHSSVVIPVRFSTPAWLSPTISRVGMNIETLSHQHTLCLQIYSNSNMFACFVVAVTKYTILRKL